MLFRFGSLKHYSTLVFPIPLSAYLPRGLLVASCVFMVQCSFENLFLHAGEDSQTLMAELLDLQEPT